MAVEKVCCRIDTNNGNGDPEAPSTYEGDTPWGFRGACWGSMIMISLILGQLRTAEPNWHSDEE